MCRIDRVGVPAAPRGDPWAAAPRGRGPGAAQLPFASTPAPFRPPGFLGMVARPAFSLRREHGGDRANEN